MASQLGDDQTVVLKVYSHWMPGKKKDAVDALDDPEYQVQSDSVKANEKYSYERKDPIIFLHLSAP